MCRMRTKPQKTRATRKVAKSAKRSLKGWAEGAREDLILRPNLARYIDAASRGWLMERKCLADICTQFHAQIPLDLADTEEPDLPLPDYDPTVAHDFGAGVSDEEKVRRLSRIGMLNRVRRRRCDPVVVRLNHMCLAHSTLAQVPHQKDHSGSALHHGPEE